ncbi:hypothetical protein KAI87_06465 [Myxococcota bacterium]|nr:hypothetical protein [Myxococcota bacterium]
MMGMGNALRDEIHAMVDDLQDEQLESVRASLRDVSYDPFENMDPAELERLHAVIERSEQQFAEGKGVLAEDVIRKLRSRQ